MLFASGSPPVIIFGTRPELIKLAPVVHELAARKITPKLIYVTQHPDVFMRPLFEFFGITPDHVVRMGSESSYIARIGDVMPELSVLLGAGPVVVQGDTLTAFAAAMTAFFSKKVLVHVEAGLRTWQHDPWPEEAQRRSISTMATWHCCPTPEAYSYLWQKENYKNAVWTGNTVVDAVGYVARRPATHPIHPALEHDRLLLVTAHRHENIGQGIADLHAAVSYAAACHLDWKVVWILHPNPKTHPPKATTDPIVYIPSLGYPQFIHTLKRAKLVLTDSGGVQEEAATLHVPLMIARGQTERMEAVKGGFAKLVGTDTKAVAAALMRFMAGDDRYDMVKTNPFAGPRGKPSQSVVDLICGN